MAWRKTDFCKKHNRYPGAAVFAVCPECEAEGTKTPTKRVTTYYDRNILLWVCVECKGSNVKAQTWFNPNLRDRPRGGPYYDLVDEWSRTWCDDCGCACELEEQTAGYLFRLKQRYKNQHTEEEDDESDDRLLDCVDEFGDGGFSYAEEPEDVS